MLKKIALYFIVVTILFPVISVFAADPVATPTEVVVTEKMPWMTECKCIADKDCKDPATRKYKCPVKGGFGSVLDMLGGMIKYATFIVALLGVLALVWSGIEMSLSGAFGDPKKAKERIGKIAMGLVLLFLIGFILNSVAPWIYQ